MPDIKFSNDDLGKKYLGVSSYFTIAQAAVKEMYQQVGDLKLDERSIAYGGLLIRHLVMPQNLAGTHRIMEFIAKELSRDTYVNVMAQYYPAYKATNYKELDTRVSKKDFYDAIKAGEEAGLTNIHFLDNQSKLLKECVVYKGTDFFHRLGGFWKKGGHGRIAVKHSFSYSQGNVNS